MDTSFCQKEGKVSYLIAHKYTHQKEKKRLSINCTTLTEFKKEKDQRNVLIGEECSEVVPSEMLTWGISSAYSIKVHTSPRVKMEKSASECPISNFLAQIIWHQDFHDCVIIEMPYQTKLKNIHEISRWIIGVFHKGNPWNKLW